MQHSWVCRSVCLQGPTRQPSIGRPPRFCALSRKSGVRGYRGCISVKSSSSGSSGFDDSSGSSPSDEFRMAPVKPRTPFGELLTYYLKMEPLLFKSAVEDQLEILKEQKEAQEAKDKAAESTDASRSELMLYERMEQMRRKEAIATLEDLMYISVIENFVELGIDMMPRMEGYLEAHGDLSKLTDGVHSKEAIEVVKSHMYNMMGASSMAFSQATIKVSKLQMAQIYAASVMFGYFLRRVDNRFQLAKEFGMLPDDKDHAAQTLEKLFNETSSMDSAENVDAPDKSSSSSQSSQGASGSGTTAKPALVKYIEQFDQATLLEMTRIVSKEGSELIERQISALFGDINELQAQMQGALPDNIFAPEDLMKEVNLAVENNKVDTLTLTVGTHRRAVLEAVAFGAFLRDVETWVERDYGILSAAPPPDIPPDSQMPPMAM